MLKRTFFILMLLQALMATQALAEPIEFGCTLDTSYQTLQNWLATKTKQEVFNYRVPQNCAYPGWSILHFLPHISGAPSTTELLNLLLEHGADPAAAAIYSLGSLRRNFSVLTHAILYLSPADIKHLLDAGANKTLVNEGPEMAQLWRTGLVLHLAAYRNVPPETIKLLIDYGSNVNAQNAWGETALHVAAEEGNTEACQALLEKGADKNIKNKNGQTASQVASLHAHNELAALLAP